MAVILGILVATTANHLLAAAARAVGRLPAQPKILRWILGISFIALAVWVLVPDKADGAPRAADGYGAFMVTATTFFMAEMGDKTQMWRWHWRRSITTSLPSLQARLLA